MSSPKPASPKAASPKASSPAAEKAASPEANSPKALSPPAAEEETEGTGAGDLHSAEHWAQLAEDAPADSDGDSLSSEDAASSTASITSSILHYRNIHGRTYHSQRGNLEYWGSNDEQQNESMDINHHLLVLSTDSKLYLAPLEDDKVHKVLDVGTGTGIWAIDFADDHPNAEVIGTDISPIQPGWVPPNCKFEMDDCTQEWTFGENVFDYVHMRYLIGSIVDWSALFKEAYRSCKPGGWVESFEASSMMESDDDTIKEGSAMNEWGKFYIEGGKKIGRSFTILNDDTQRKCMEEAGFTNIHVWNHKASIGPWAKDPRQKEIGQYALYTLEQDLEGYVLYMANVVLGWSREEVAVYCAQLRRELRSGKHHGFYRQRVVYGQKPIE